MMAFRRPGPASSVIAPDDRLISSCSKPGEVLLNLLPSGEMKNRVRAGSSSG
jgi:hypothetical protein